MKTEHTKQSLRALPILFCAVLLLTVFDQWTKRLAVLHLKGQGPIRLIDGVFELTYLENRGAAFGLFQDQRIIFLLITTVVVAVVLVLYWRLPKNKRFLPLQIIAAGILSGAAGNMIDRLLQGYVVDFFYFRLIDFPVFNVADIYVTVSAIVFVILLTFYYKDEEFDAMTGRNRKR